MVIRPNQSHSGPISRNESTRSRTFASNGTTTRSEIAPEIASEVLKPGGGLGEIAPEIASEIAPEIASEVLKPGGGLGEIVPEIAPEVLKPGSGLGGSGGSAGGAGGAAVGLGGALMTGAVWFVTSLSACNGKVRSCLWV